MPVLNTNIHKVVKWLSLRFGGLFDGHLIANLLLSVAVKEF